MKLSFGASTLEKNQINLIATQGAIWKRRRKNAPRLCALIAAAANKQRNTAPPQEGGNGAGAKVDIERSGCE